MLLRQLFHLICKVFQEYSSPSNVQKLQDAFPPSFFRTQQLLFQTSPSKKMITGPQSQETQKTYMKYTREMRIRLIQLVEKEKMSTAEAGRQVGIKQTSACRIINSYKKHNRIFERKADRFVRQAQIEKNKEQKNSQKDSINSSNSSSEFKHSPKIETDEKNKKSELKLSSSQQTCPAPANCQQKVVLQCPSPLGQRVYNPWVYAAQFQIPMLWQFPFLF